MRLRHLIPLLVSTLLACACNNKANISGEIKDYPNGEIVVARLGVGSFTSVDTIKTSSRATFKYSLDLKEGQPAFVYVYKGSRRIASLLVEKGEKVEIVADTLGCFSVEGSQGSSLLSDVEKRFADFGRAMDSTEDSKELGKMYIEYYRSCVKYVMEHPYSLTSINVLYQKLNNMDIFSQYTDALHFRTVCDSLKTKYPNSEYVKALEKETLRRENLLGLSTAAQNAETIAYPELNMPDINGNKVSLRGVESKAILLHFWSAEDVAQSMMNIEVLQSIYDQYRSRGLEIYSVCLSPKVQWATVVRNQDLQWINVNDGLGANSPAVRLYNISNLPVAFLIADGEMVTESVKDAAGLRRQLDKLL